MMSRRLRAAIAAAFLAALPVGQAVAYDGFALSTEQPAWLDSRIENAARRQGVPPWIALSIASTRAPLPEATGPMNVVPAVARHYGFAGRDIRNADRNIETGVRLLDELYHRFGTWDQAVLAYQWGPPAGRRGLAGASREQRAYVADVLDRQSGRREWSGGGIARQLPSDGRRSRGWGGWDDGHQGGVTRIQPGFGAGWDSDYPSGGWDDGQVEFRRRGGGAARLQPDSGFGGSPSYAPARPAERSARQRDQGRSRNAAPPPAGDWQDQPVPTYEAKEGDAPAASPPPPVILAPPTDQPSHAERVDTLRERHADAPPPAGSVPAATPPQRTQAERIEILRERAPVNLAPPPPAPPPAAPPPAPTAQPPAPTAAPAAAPPAPPVVPPAPDPAKRELPDRVKKALEQRKDEKAAEPTAVQ